MQNLYVGGGKTIYAVIESQSNNFCNEKNIYPIQKYGYHDIVPPIYIMNYISIYEYSVAINNCKNSAFA